MKRFILIAITCIVVDQLKAKAGWITECQGIEVNGEVIFDQKIVKGQMVTYRPYVSPGDEIIHGQIMGIGDAPKEGAPVPISSDTGKVPL